MFSVGFLFVPYTQEVVFAVNEKDFIDGRVTSQFLPTPGPMKDAFDSVSETLRPQIVERLRKLHVRKSGAKQEL